MVNYENIRIPSSWSFKIFREIAKFYSGGTPLTTKTEYYNGEIPFIKSGEIYFERTEQNISDDGLRYSSAKMVNKGDLLYALYGANSGEVAISKIKGAINQAILCIKLNDGCDTVYLYNFLLSKQESIIKKYLQGGQGNLSAEIIKSLKILLPPLAEQKAIAHVLGVMDTAINKNNQLIAQKELRKKWLMQKLLTGKKRLKGFKGEWEDMRLGDLTTWITRRNKDLIDAPVYSVTNTNGFVLQSDHFEGRVAGEDVSNYKIIKRNEFAYNPARINVGSIAYFEKEIGVISSLYVCFNTKKEILDYFLQQYLKTDYARYRIRTLGEGGVRVYLWYELFSKIKIKLPSLEEQNSIVSFMQALEKEIQLLKTKTEKLQEQKKWLMQVLLTGKKRLKLI